MSVFFKSLCIVEIRGKLMQRGSDVGEIINESQLVFYTWRVFVQLCPTRRDVTSRFPCDVMKTKHSCQKIQEHFFVKRVLSLFKQYS